MKRVFVLTAIRFAAAATIVAWLAGCAGSNSGPKSDSIPAVGTSIAKCDAHIQSADLATAAAVPHADSDGKVLLGTVRQEHAAALACTADAQTSLVKAETERQELVKENQKTQADFVRFQQRFLIRVAVFIENAIKWIIGLSILGFGCFIAAEVFSGGTVSGVFAFLGHGAFGFVTYIPTIAGWIGKSLRSLGGGFKSVFAWLKSHIYMQRRADHELNAQDLVMIQDLLVEPLAARMQTNLDALGNRLEATIAARMGDVDRRVESVERRLKAMKTPKRGALAAAAGWLVLVLVQAAKHAGSATQWISNHW